MAGPERSDSDLPVASELERIVAAARSGCVVVTAPPGSGKTTLVPPALLDDGDAGGVILVQPRRLAARAIARRLAHLRGGTVGKEVGYQVRFDCQASPQTRLLVVTTGILLRRLLDDADLPGVATVVLDEFHERTIEMDLALGMLCRIRQTIRPDLRIVVMSATLATERIAEYLGNCPVIHAEGRMYPVQIRHLPRRDLRPLPQQVASAVGLALRETPGHVLVFLPGVGEIVRCRDELAPVANGQDLDLLVLYGDLPAEDQDRVLAPGPRRKVILATNIAETSLTIDGVTAVVDSGQARQMRMNPAVGIPKLERVPISQASADQRAGRAGRTGPGTCWRLWDAASHRARPVAEPPEIRRGDLGEVCLMLAAWGEPQVLDFPWLDPPTSDAMDSAFALLTMLGAIAQNRQVTTIGHQLVRLPTHPRLARLILAGGESGVLRETALTAALLSERDPFRVVDRGNRPPQDRRARRSRSDLADRVAALLAWHRGEAAAYPDLVCNPAAAHHVFRVADQLLELAAPSPSSRTATDDMALLRSLLTAFPDRLATLRSGSHDRGRMVGGRGVRLDECSHVRGEPLFLCLDLQDAPGEARVRLASAVERDWLPEGSLMQRDELFFNPTRGHVEARRRTYWYDLLLEETPTAITDSDAAAAILAQHARPCLDRVLDDEESAAARFRARVQWLAEVMPDLDLPHLTNDAIADRLKAICQGLRSLEEVRNVPWVAHLQAIVGHHRLFEIDQLAPERIEVPSGNRLAITYQRHGAAVLSVRIQEIFGWQTSPRLAAGRRPLVLQLLGPNHRPQQVTDDLESFWRNTYPVIRKELRRRYPRHAWPDDPLTSPATRSGLSRDT